jgi:catechol 2,3-dioxygenase-like lactoylglutathione lyase family enzyme
MAASSFSTVLPVADLAAAVDYFKALLGVEPTFVDGDNWAQFDVGPRRIALAGADKVSDKAGLMVKVDDLEAEIARIQADGGIVGPPQEGAHEIRAVAEGPGGWPIVLYAPKPQG